MEVFSVCIYQRVGLGKVPFSGFRVQIAVIGLHVDDFGKKHVV